MKKQAFTLAETLITLTILGVVAAITVPSLINKQMESANRTKIKKAMAVYEKALNQMVIDNDIKSETGLLALNDATCSKTYEYFKIVENLNSSTNCEFKTADRVYWNITDIQHPIISTDKDKRNDTSFDKTFTLAGYYDDNNILRINDLGAAKDTNKTNLTKVYEFVLNKKIETQQHRFGQYDSLKEFQECSDTITTWCKNTKTCDNSNNYICTTYYANGYVYEENNDGNGQSEWVLYDKQGLLPYTLTSCDSYGMNCEGCAFQFESCPIPDTNGKYNVVFSTHE